MKIYDTEVRKRPYDGKWQLNGKIDDHENSYTFQDEKKRKVTLVPTKWITLNVFDYLVDAEDAQKSV